MNNLPPRVRPRLYLTLIPAFFLAVSCTLAQAADKPMVDYINPMIGAGTSGGIHGKTFPGAATPFGLVQLSPDTITGGDNGSGYSYPHHSIEGFSFTHMSGVGWYGDLGNFLVMPTIGPLRTERGTEGAGDGYRSRFRHETEIARAGYYAVTLDDSSIRVEATAAPRSGILRFTFPKADQSRIQIDLARRVGGTSTLQSVKVIGDHTIEGWMKCPPAGGGWGDGHSNYTVYYHAEFSKPIIHCGVWSADIPDDWKRKRENIESQIYHDRVAKAAVLDHCREMEGKHLGFFSEFSTTEGEQVMLKAGISFVSIQGARENLAHDQPGWDFDGVRARARALWADALKGVDVQGGDDARKEVFATALYHSFIDPRSYSDVDGQYTGADGKPHRAEGFTYRTIFSGWDVFRSEYPMLTLLRPDVVNDTVNSLIQQAEFSGNGYLARWEILGTESGCMNGEPAISVFAGAYLAGIRGYDAEKAYALCKDTAEGPKTNRDQVQAWIRDGYVPGSLSESVGDAYYDYCAGRFAEALGKKDDAAVFMKRALNYRNVYDPTVGNMRAKDATGQWEPWHGDTGGGKGCTESTPYQENWFVPQDPQGLMNLMGRDYFEKHLAEFFEKTPADFRWNDYFNASNEPVALVPYLWTYDGKPWLTQKWTRFTLDHAYGPGVHGLPGDDDVGQMSAWYVLNALGLHPESPVDGIYILGSPVFDRVTFRLDPHYAKGTSFTIIARNNSRENLYIQSAKLNGKPLERAWLRHDEITAGGTLELMMGPEPNKTWGSDPKNLPPSLSARA